MEKLIRQLEAHKDNLDNYTKKLLSNVINDINDLDICFANINYLLSELYNNNSNKGLIYLLENHLEILDEVEDICSMMFHLDKEYLNYIQKRINYWQKGKK